MLIGVILEAKFEENILFINKLQAFTFRTICTVCIETYACVQCVHEITSFLLCFCNKISVEILLHILWNYYNSIKLLITLHHNIKFCSFQIPYNQILLFCGTDSGHVYLFSFHMPSKCLFEMPFKKTNASWKILFMVKTKFLKIFSLNI